ncbi:MAG: hypothetical protein K0U93_24050 [Gammaproteobacteria bacterium]|nr:hypothetical protein [Gammaproteobacteria bacterium]
MSLETIIAECVSIAGTIPGIGVIHDHEVVVSNRKGLEDNFMSGGVINCLEIDRDSTPATRRTGRGTIRAHQIAFRFYHSLQEGLGSRATFRTLVETAEEVFRGQFNLNGVALESGPFSISIDAYIEKAGAPLHYAECAMPVKEFHHGK